MNVSITKVLDYEPQETNFSVTDSTIISCFSSLPKDVVIFLDSCSSGKHGLVDEIKKVTGEESTVIGAKESYYVNLRLIRSVDPFEVVILSEDGKDLTYKK